MPVLLRQDTRSSLLSWWSDNNPLLHGPTINLHAAAKHGCITGKPLSKESVEIYGSYLSYKYVAIDTRLMVLNHLTASAYIQDTAQHISQSSVPELCAELLANPTLRQATCSLIAVLLAHALGVTQVKAAIEEIVSMLCEEQTDEVARALASSSTNALQLGGARLIAFLLASQIPLVTEWACAVIAKLARHAPTEPVNYTPFEQLLNLVQNADDPSSLQALLALDALAQHPDGASAITSTDILENILTSLHSRSANVQTRICVLVASLAKHKLALLVIIVLWNTPVTTSLLNVLPSDRDDDTVLTATFALCTLAEHSTAAGAIVSSDALGNITRLLFHRTPAVRDQACILIDTLVKHAPVASAGTLWASPIHELLSQLRTENNDQISRPRSEYLDDPVLWSMSTLTEIAKHPRGVEALMESEMIVKVATFFDSRNVYVRSEAFSLIEAVAAQGLLSKTALGRISLQRMEHLIEEANPDIVVETVFALTRISGHPDGAAAVIKSHGVLETLAALLESMNTEIQRRACVFFSALAEYEFTVLNILRDIPIEIVINLLNNKNREIILEAMFALSRFAQHPDGAVAVVAANILEYVEQLLASESSLVRFWTCELIATLAKNELAVSAILVGLPMEALFSALLDENDDVASRMMVALRKIARCEAATALPEALSRSQIPERFGHSSTVVTLLGEICAGIAAVEDSPELIPESIVDSLGPEKSSKKAGLTRSVKRKLFFWRSL
ncbi:armadillo-type protein [Roridomyces roridus]|uniref:Armadillo-type protein n=1 Tax=Roridomyces roridus TaxID=1738132 RepID=A0AAD7B2K8_9AGAR|nr:armadillo-type protein [Roridomyces roridus]